MLLHETSRATRRKGVLRRRSQLSDERGRPADRRGIVTAARRRGVRHPGALVTTAVALVSLAFAAVRRFSTHRARASKATKRPTTASTYSLARDRDFTFQRQDLIRVWEEFPGPEGIFLKRGASVDFKRSSSFPFFTLVSGRSGRARPALLRQVVHLSAVRGAVRVADRDQRVSSSSTRCC